MTKSYNYLYLKYIQLCSDPSYLNGIIPRSKVSKQMHFAILNEFIINTFQIPSLLISACLSIRVTTQFYNVLIYLKLPLLFM